MGDKCWTKAGQISNKSAVFSFSCFRIGATKEKPMTTAAQLSENSHQGFEGLKAALCLAEMEAKSNPASGMPVCLRRNGIGSRSSSKERDAETGLDFFLARYYSGAQGRFLSPDEFKGGIVDPFTGKQISQPGPLPYADIRDPQTINKYAYVRNNPLRYIDPDGHAAETILDIFSYNESRKEWGQAVNEFVENPSVQTGLNAAAKFLANAWDSGALLLPGIPGGMGLVKKLDKIDNIADKLPPKTVVEQEGVKITHYTKSGDHGPAHSHVQGEGPNTRIGQNGKPLKNDPELSPTQRNVVTENLKTIRKSVKSIMKWFTLNNE
jgi:RHS repeat-associated protein